MTTMSAALRNDRVYLAHDRFVCGTVRCAGASALFSGETTGGAPVTPVTVDDVREWASYDLGEAICQCGRLTATTLLGSDGFPITKENQP
jgi:hypothetical protein